MQPIDQKASSAAVFLDLRIGIGGYLKSEGKITGIQIVTKSTPTATLGIDRKLEKQVG